MKKQDQKGFGLSGILIVVTVVGAVVFASWYVLHSKSASKASSASQSTISKTAEASKVKTPAKAPGLVATADGKISLVLPDTWRVMESPENVDAARVISVNKHTQICKGGTCGTAGCLNVDDTVPCTYEASFQPKSLEKLNQKVTSNYWLLRVEKTDLPIEKIADDKSSPFVAEYDPTPINGYESRKVVIVSEGNYTDVNYYIKHNGYLLQFSNREKYIHASAESPIKEDYSAYRPDFTKIVQSLKLNF